MKQYFFLILISFSHTISAQEYFMTVKKQKVLHTVTILDSTSKNHIIVKENIDSVCLLPLSSGCLPLKGIIEITSRFGSRKDPFTGKMKTHRGIDIRTESDSILSMMDGIVSRVEYNPFLGISVTINHGVYTSIYGHLSKVFVKRNNFVKTKQLIGISGNTGRSTGEHLHLSIKRGKKYIDPVFYFKLILQKS